MKHTKFGVEIEFTGITRKQAAEIAVAFFGSGVSHRNSYYRYTTLDASGRTWTYMYQPPL